MSSRELANRCVLTSACYEKAMFLTLTYDETKEGYHNKFELSDIQEFNKKLRRYVTYHYDKKIEIFYVHEYGKNGKKHWHVIVFGHEFQDRRIHTYKNSKPLFKSKKLEELWAHGFCSIGDVSEASAMYQAQYMEKDFQYGHAGTPKKCHSQHSGLGRTYFLKNYKQILRLGYVPINGTKMPLPRYFEKLAHKHYCHFYDQSQFIDNKWRKAPYRPFKPGQENKEIADLFIKYQSDKKQKLLEKEEEWKETVTLHLTTKEKPDFVKAGENKLYDLINKKTIDQL